MLSQLLLLVCHPHGDVLLTDPMESDLEGRTEGLECNASSAKARGGTSDTDSSSSGIPLLSLTQG